MVVKCRQGPGFNSLATDTFVLNWKTLPFPPSRNGLPFNPGQRYICAKLEDFALSAVEEWLAIQCDYSW